MFLNKIHRIILLLVCSVTLLGASAMGPSEHQLKAIFIVKLLKFIEWPSGEGDIDKKSVHIGVLGKSPMLDALGALQNQGNIQIRVTPLKSPSDLDTARIIYVSSALSSEETLLSLKGKKVLTIGESPDFARLGGMINLLIVNESLKFELNVQVLKDAGYSVNSRVLKVADKIW